MSDQQNLRDLAAYFQPDQLEWRAITISKRTNKGLAAAYITNRAIMDRLDEVVGPENWRNEYRPGPNGGVVCGLSICVDRGTDQGEWVTKWDGADNTEVEAIKGGLSNAMRRAAVQWGVGRYLYDLPQQWVPVDDFKQFKVTPRVPDRFLPPRAQPVQRSQPAQRPQRTRDRAARSTAPSDAPSPGAHVYKRAEDLGFSRRKIEATAKQDFGCAVAQLRSEQADALILKMQNRVAADSGGVA